MTETDGPFRVEVTIAAPVSAVWRALRVPELIRRWHGWEFDTDGGLDAEVDFIYRQHFTESEATHTLTIQGDDTFTLHDIGEGRTLVRMVRAPRGTNPEWDAYYEDVNEGWTTFPQQLRFALERPGTDRRRVVPVDQPTRTHRRCLARRAPDRGYGATVASPGGTAMPWLCSRWYGLDGPKLDELRDRWTAWWRDRFTPPST